jgi:transposase InsO family protein
MQYGCPHELFSDRASSFLSEALQAYLELQTIRHKATTPYHPRTNGMVERMHSMLGHSLTTLSNGQPAKWDEYLAQAVFAMRVRTHAVTKKSPFFLIYGVHPRIPGDTDPPDSFTDQWEQAFQEQRNRDLDPLYASRGTAYLKSVEQATKMKERIPLIDASPAYFFKINDWVKMKKHDSTKFEFEWKGPYIVVDVGFPGTYWLMEPSGRRLDSTISQSDLAPWRAAIAHGEEYFHDGTPKRTDFSAGVLDVDSAYTA